MKRDQRLRQDRGVPDCDEQMPVISHTGRGLAGNSYKVEIDDPDSESETHLHGYVYDSATKEWASDWVSENINGGKLSYQYVLRPHTIPQTFTITFIYRRPGRTEWSWTTPAIPYVWTIDDDGNRDDPDSIVGSGVATLFIKKTTEEKWTEKLVYPDGTTREDYNAPEAEEAWTVNLSFGIGGDVEVPNIDDLAKILGITVQDIYNIIEDKPFTIDGVDYDDLRDYIDKRDQDMLNHFHDDLGFPDKSLAADGGEKTDEKPWQTVKEYVDWQVSQLANKYNTALADILNKVVGGGTLNDDGTVTWNITDGKIAIGTINLYSNATDGDDNSAVIRTHTGTAENDIQSK